MKVLYIAPFATVDFLNRNGDTRVSSIGGLRKVSMIAEILVRQEHQVVILSSVMLSNSRIAWRKSRQEQVHFGGATIDVIYPSALMLRPFGGLLNCVRSPSIVRQILSDFIPDATIAYNSYLFETLAARELVRLLRIPIMLEVEDLPLARKRGWFNIKPRLDQQCWKYMLQLSAGFTAVNDSILKQLPEGKPRFLLPGIIDERLRILASERAGPFGHDQRTVGYFGGLAIEKGVQVLLRLVHCLPKGWRLVISGSGPLAAQFASLSEQYAERITFLGRVSDEELYQTMCRCDCTVIPREQITGSGEGVFPFKTLEYLVAGTHVIASRLPTLQGLDISFVQRWDGISLESLLVELQQAESRYKQELIVRKNAVDAILSRYSFWGVSRIFSDLLSVSADHTSE